MSTVQPHGLQEVAEMLRHRWDPLILALLGQGPLRYRDLSGQVRQPSGEMISNGVLSEALDRMGRKGFVVKTMKGDRTVYQLTPMTAWMVHELCRIAEAACRCTASDCGVSRSS